MFFYVVVNGRRLPEPYNTLKEAMDAAEALQAKLCVPCDVVMD